METASKEILMSSLIELLQDKRFKKDFVNKVNENVDIPMINEKTEEKVLKSLYKILLQQVEKAVEELQKKD